MTYMSFLTSTISRKFFFLLGFIFTLNPVFSDSLLTLAEELARIEEYDEAITEYKRFLFFHPDSEEKSAVLYEIALALRAANRLDECIQVIRTSILYARTPEEKFEREIGLVVALLGNENYSGAEFQLLSMRSSKQSDEQKAQIAYSLGIVYISTFRWQDARNAFAYAFSLPGGERRLQDLQDFIFTLIEKAEAQKQKSVTTAQWLSVFLPGVGQLYAGSLTDGLNAFIINSLSTPLL